MSIFMALIPVIALGAPQAAAVPPPPQQLTADCEAPTYASDMLVCANPVLQELDSRMRASLAAVDFASVVAQGAWVEGQGAWFQRRSLCAFSGRHADCLLAAYVERIAVLEAMGRVAPRASRQGTEVSCPGAPWNRSRVRARAPESGALTFETDHAQVFLAATPATMDDVWSPFVGFRVDGLMIRLSTLEGTTITCTFMAPRRP